MIFFLFIYFPQKIQNTTKRNLMLEIKKGDFTVIVESSSIKFNKGSWNFNFFIQFQIHGYDKM